MGLEYTLGLRIAEGAASEWEMSCDTCGNRGGGSEVGGTFGGAVVASGALAGETALYDVGETLR